MRGLDRLIADAELEYLANDGVLSLSTQARLAEAGAILPDLEESFEELLDYRKESLTEWRRKRSWCG